MATRMLIDARHPEETRVAVLKGNRIEEFDFESADKKQIKGNIYLAKVTRVEPSLQAAFVDFGGNRHGFLAFSEIHPDYYQIPKEDREALLAEEAAHAEEEAALRAAEEAEGEDDNDESFDELDDEDDESGVDGGLTEVDTSESDHVSTIEAGHVENGDEDGEAAEAEAADDTDGEGASQEAADNGDGEQDGSRSGRPRRRGRRQGRGRSKEAEDLRSRRMALRRRYKIQDVIQRRQVLLVQVVKEERGNKGAALTTYLSLAGRYCVLMPNSSHGGGISRKISSASDRKRLKAIINDLNLPKSMGCIVRTAGLSRTKTEIKRDFDYLARLWDELRERTLASSAPMLIHSDSDLIKRAIRDIYNRDIEEVIVEGEDGYRAAKDFMKLLMPSHARRVKAYSDPVPLFQRFGAEDQLTAMYDPEVQLKSGGYIVINPTEALVSIDINSGRATKEHGIEATAVNTNLEAAQEIARQLRLRDMAGLVVIDFIDMEYSSNVRKVERAMKEALKHDRARIQVGRISSFGLKEMSRQRLRTGVLEATTRACPHCDGTGLVRTASSAGLSALRLIEDEAAKGKGIVITLFASTEAAVYLLNSKRSDLADIEARYGVSVEVIPEGENEGAKMRVTSSGPRQTALPVFEPIIDEDEDDEDLSDVEFEGEDEEAEGGSRRGKRRRRRRGRGRDRQQRDDYSSEDEADEAEALEEEAQTSGEEGGESGEDAPKKRRRRGGRRRRGRGRGEDGEAVAVDAPATNDAQAADEIQPEPEADDGTQDVSEVPFQAEEPEEAPKPRSRRKKAKTDENEPQSDSTEQAEVVAEAKPKRTRRKKVDAAESAEEPAGEETPKPKRTRRKKTETAETGAEEEAPQPEEATADEKPKPKRTRRKKAEEPVEASGDEPALAQVSAPEVQEAETPAEAVQASVEGAEQSDDDGAAPRRGWWQRTFGE